MVASAGCLPDMAVHDQQLTWSAGARSTTAVITNRGARATGPFAVILTAEDCSSTLRWKNRARVFREVGSLEPGASATVAADFAGAGNEPNGFLADVSAVSCIADFNRLVPEGNEYNNVARLPTYSVAGLADHTYNEMLGTILRGILVREPFASELGIRPGYYRAGQFRVWNLPAERVLTAGIEKNYATYVSGPSSLPVRHEPWVFSIVDEDRYDASGWSYRARDFHGNSFQFALDFGTLPTFGCITVERAMINCLDVGLTTESLGGRLTTCGVREEPPWTLP